MTPEEQFQPHVIAVFRWMRLMAPDPRAIAGQTSFLDLFRDDPAMLDYARAEIKRLEGSPPGARRTLADHDQESRDRRDAIARMITLHEEANA